MAIFVAQVVRAQPVGAEDQQLRSWQSRNGKYTIGATLVDVRDGKAVLERADGTRIAVAADDLSHDDRQYLGQWQARRAEAARQQRGSKYENTSRVRATLGVEIVADRSAFRKLVATFPLPMDWPEQSVKIVGKELSPQVARVRERVLEDGVKQVEVQIPQLAAGETARAVYVVDIERRWILAPPNPEIFVVAKDVPRALRRYLEPSPTIESAHAEIRKLAAQFPIDPDQPAWPQIEPMYRWVREHIDKVEGAIELRSALSALRDRRGDCEEYTSLFVALCRAQGIPARSVWVPGHAYPEFYVQDRDGNGYWFPCESLGPYSFGKLHNHGVVLQKGDNFKMSQKKDRQRYVSETLSGFPVGPGGGQPVLRPVQEFEPIDRK